MYKAVLFDLDGTLIDSADDLGAALNYVHCELSQPPIDGTLYRTQASNGTLALLKLGFGELWESFDTDKIKALKQKFLDFYSQNLWKQSTFYEGVVPLIQFLDEHGIKWSIVTNKPAHLTDPLIKQIPEFGHCHNIISGDTLDRAKPNPDPLLHSCKLMKVKSEDCIYIGDDERDIIAGNRAGMKTAAALWGYLNGNPATNWQADLFLDSPWLLLDHISSN